MRGKNWVYPDRQRCLKCRRYFAFAVIQRLYCSEECAGVDASLGAAPRACKVLRGGEWHWKRVWWSERAVKRAAKSKGAGGWYYCDGPRGCLGYHLSKMSPEQYADKLAREASN